MSPSNPTSPATDLERLYPTNPQVPWPRGQNELRSAFSQLSEILLTLLDAEEAEPVRPSLEPNALSAQLELTLSSEPQRLDEVLDHLKEIMKAAPLTGGPRFFNQLFAGRDPAAVCGEILAAFGNHSVYTYKVAAPLVLMESELIRRLGQFAGFIQGDEECGGIFTPGGSLSNLAAMLCARDHCQPQGRERGGLSGRIYTSEESHYSVKKGAGIIGVGRDHVIAIECDEQGRMNPEALEVQIHQDRQAGLLPMMVVATAGTTVRGAFDPFEALAEVCERASLWLHVDGAFGGTALLTPQLAELTLHRL